MISIGNSKHKQANEQIDSPLDFQEFELRAFGFVDRSRPKINVF